MKKLLLFIALLVSLGTFAQTRSAKIDSIKKEVQLPAPAQVPDKLYFLILPRSNWDKILTMLRRSKNPSDEIDDAITYILQNAKEFVPPAPAADSVKPKK